MKIVSCEHFFKLKYYKMKLSLRLLLLLPFIFVLVGCPGTDDPPVEALRSYSEVYNEDIAEIEEFMDTHFTTVDANYNVTFTKITAATPGTPISDALDTSANQDDPAKLLKHKIVSVGGVDHKLYFLKLREGSGGSNGDMQPTKLDSILPTYKGYKLDLSVFDVKNNVTDWMQLPDLIQGWQEIFPLFKAADNAVVDNGDGTYGFSNFGAGVMFVPSGLAYFNQGAGSISAYTPIIFSFKLMRVRFKDLDGDKILSKDEYGGPTSGTALDSDGDGKPDYGDYDDDNDGLLTKNEIKKPVITPGVHPGWYAYDAPELDCALGNGKRRYLNPNTGCN